METYDKNIPDIPDAAKKEIPRAVMSSDVKNEREFRRYVKKDGTFCKDFENFFNRDTGRQDSAGRIVYETTMTKDQAEKLIIEVCEKAGRKVTRDTLSGRLRATPGWDLNIRVPGMTQSEQKASTVPEGVLRERLNNQLILEQSRRIDELTAAIAKSTTSKRDGLTAKAGK